MMMMMLVLVLVVVMTSVAIVRVLMCCVVVGCTYTGVCNDDDYVRASESADTSRRRHSRHYYIYKRMSG